MNAHFSRIALAAALGLGLTLSAIPDASAGGRDRVVSRSQNAGSVSNARTTPRGDTVDRQRQWSRDGEGNAKASSSGQITGVNGGSAQRQGSSYRNADGSAGRRGSASFTGPNGASGSTSGGFTRDANGNVNGSRTTQATGPDGGSYNGSTTVTNGRVTHTGTCTNAAGETVPCRGR